MNASDENKRSLLQSYIDAMRYTAHEMNIYAGMNVQNKINICGLAVSVLYSERGKYVVSEENEPYSDDKILTKIFQLIIQSLDGIQSPDDEGYDFHFRVLESISTVQSYIVMNDLENDHLLMQLTRTLFKITKEKTIKLALTHITDILCFWNLFWRA